MCRVTLVRLESRSPLLRGSFVDITEQDRAQRELASTAAILAAEHDTSPDGIWVVDLAGRVVSFNSRMCEIFSISAELLELRDLERFLPLASRLTNDADAYFRRVRYLYDHPHETAQDELLLNDGRILDRRTAPFRNADGEILGRIWFFRDITERRRGEDALRASEERFRMLVEEAPDAILLYDFDRVRFLAANRAAERLLGASRDEIVERGPRYFFTRGQPDEREAVEMFTRHAERALAGEQVTVERHIRRHSDDQRLCRATLVRLPSNVRLLRVSLVDITESKDLENRLRQSHQRFDALYRSGFVGVLMANMDGQVTDANDRFLQMVGYSREDLEAGLLNWRILTPPEYAGTDDRGLAELLAFGESRTPYEKEYIRKDGSRIPVFINILLLDDFNTLAFVLDLTERKLAERHSQLMFAERIGLMQSMAAGLAHEINQPLAATRSFLGSARQLLALPPERRPITVEAALDEASDNVVRAGQIVSRLREFIAHNEPDKSFVRLHDLIREAVSLVAPTAERRGIEVTLELHGANDEIVADPIQIGQVLANLLRNAQEAIQETLEKTDGERGAAAIVVSTASTETHIHVDIADTGKGLSDSVKRHLFEPFVTSKAKGMGVGLVISRAIVEAHDGHLRARSNELGGATFSFTLPIASAADEVGHGVAGDRN